MDFINNIFGKKEHWGSIVSEASRGVSSSIGLDAETLFLKKFKNVGDFESEMRESILFTTAGVDNGNMKIKDSSYNAAEIDPIGRWNEYCRDTKRQMRKDGDAYKPNAMQQYIKRRYDLCPVAFSEVIKPTAEQLEDVKADLDEAIEQIDRTEEEKQQAQKKSRETQEEMDKQAENVANITDNANAVASEVFWPNKMIDNFAPFKNVEHLTMREKANQWVEQQNIIRRDYISRLDNIQSEVDLEIENTLNNGNKLLNYKRFTRATIFLIKVAILTIIIFIGWYMVKMIRER